MAKLKRSTKTERQLIGLISVGPSIRDNFAKLGITEVRQLAKANPNQLYDRLCRLTGERQDPCVLDVFTAAVAQAKNPRLPAAQCQWWYWSRVRKAGEQKQRRRAA
jgi:predicted RecB family nuclease